MGVRGLMGLLKERQQDQWTEETLDTVVVDANSFVIELYHRTCDWKLGGDYSHFGQALATFLEHLSDDNIKATFVFDGGIPREKFQTQLARSRGKCLVVQKHLGADARWAHLDGLDDSAGPTPALVALFAKHVMEGRGVDFLTADLEADAPVVDEAVRQGAFVVSNDSDLMLMKGPRGVVITEEFVQRPAGSRRLRAISVDSVAKVFGLKPVRLPELGTLAGNDYVDIEDEGVKAFHQKVLQVYGGPREPHPRWRLLQALGVWLQKRDPRIWQRDEALKRIPRESWDYSLQSYRHQSNGSREEISDKATSLRLQDHEPDDSTSTHGSFPTWLARALRRGPAVPRQLFGLMATGVHLACPLVEPLEREGEATAWLQSLHLRAAAAAALGLRSFVDVTPVVVEETDGCLDVDFRKPAHEVASFKGLPRIPAECSRLLARADGPRDAEEREALLRHLYAALRWEAEGSRPSEELLPKCRWLQLAALRYWVATHGGQQGEPPRWLEVAALSLLLIMPQEARADVCSRIRPPAQPRPDVARALAGFESCLISALELHAAVAAPLGPVDFRQLYDGPFLHALAGAERLKASELLEDEPAKRQFDAVLRLLLESLKGQMKPRLRGSAKLKGAAWHFSDAAPPSAGEPASRSEGAGDAAQQRKRLAKKLEQIAKLEAKGGKLSEEELQKVAQKGHFEDELARLEGSSSDPTLLDLWSVSQSS